MYDALSFHSLSNSCAELTRNKYGTLANLPALALILTQNDLSSALLTITLTLTLNNLSSTALSFLCVEPFFNEQVFW